MGPRLAAISFSCSTGVLTIFQQFKRIVASRFQTTDRNDTGLFKCASCGSARVRRSEPQGPTESLALPLLRLYPFHCIDCYQRFYSRSLPNSQPIHDERREPETTTRAPEAVKNHPPETTQIPARLNQEERRTFSRLSCRIPARIVADASLKLTGIVNTISLNGCFVETPRSVPTGSDIDLTLEIGETTRVRGVVRSVRQTTGMGIEFTDMTVPNFRRLRSIARDSVRLNPDL